MATLLCIVLAAFMSNAFGESIDHSLSPVIFETNELPLYENNGTLQDRHFASVGNGHVATTCLADFVYMNGLYNGYRGESHRARIPSRNNLKITPVGQEDFIQNHLYGLNVAEGYFYEKYEVLGYAVEQRIFAHRVYNRIIVNLVIINATVNAEPEGVEFMISNDQGEDSQDIEFSVEEPPLDGVTLHCGKIRVRENPQYTQQENVCVMSTTLPEDPVLVTPGNSVRRVHMASYGFSTLEAETDYASADIVPDILESHVSAWRDLWAEGSIEVDGNLELSKVINGGLYAVLSSLPVTSGTWQPNNQFYGLSPGGLNNGRLGRDYQGHSFWDAEMWKMPPMLYLFPDKALEMISYRLFMVGPARDHANATGYKGIRWPWESAGTGSETTPEFANHTAELQIHNTADISHAIRQYIAVTRDTNWLKQVKPGYLASPCEVLREIAEFYTSWAVFNTSTRLHDIRGIMPPDEDNFPVDNNPFTNIIAGYAIYYAKYAECLCAGAMDPIPPEWLDLASSLNLLYDEERKFHPEFEGYEPGHIIKQSDVVLLGFPLHYEMDPEARRNDLLIYENATRKDGPAMSWSMHTIGFLDLDDVDYANEQFNKSYKLYVREPFKIWTEKQENHGTVNFVTGISGFLQALISGWGGLRLYPEKLLFRQPRTPLNTTELMVKGIDYLGNVLDVTVKPEEFSVTLVRSNINYPLVAVHNGNQTDLVSPGTTLTFSTAELGFLLEVKTTRPSGCQNPVDKIGTPLP